MYAISVPATLESLEAIRRYIFEVGRIAGLDKSTSYKLRLAVDEVATNIISYGYIEAGLEGYLEIQALINDSQLSVLVEDESAPFDPNQASTPDVEADLDNRAIGGLGLFLALNYVDKLLYHRVKEKNQTVLLVNRQLVTN